MFLFYFIWNSFFYLVSISHVWFEKKFLIVNNPFLTHRRSFKFMSYFEKLFLVFFYKKGWFDKSLANLYRKKDILEYRRSYYPIIYSFYIINNEVSYEIDNISLKFYIKLFNFFNTKKIYFKKLNKCFYYNNKDIIKYTSLVKIFFKKYFNLESNLYYRNINELNLIKFNKLFFLFFLNSKYKFVFYDLDKWYDWYNYTFEKNWIKNFSIIKKVRKYGRKRKSFIKELNLIKFHLMFYKYKLRLRKFSKFFKSKQDNILYFNLNLNNFFKIKINPYFSYLMKYYTVKFSESSITKYLNTKNLKNYTFFYLRKNRIFNKGRYSRNRQLYRTGVYWCLWLNIIMVYGLYFIFYRFSFNFGYFWWGLMVLAYSTIFSRIIKYNFFNINYLYKEFYNLIGWCGSLYYSFYLTFCFFFEKYLYSNEKLNTLSLKHKKYFGFFFEKYYYYLAKFYKKFVIERRNHKNFYMWRGMKERDSSFMRYKTILHWIKELYRLIVTK